MSGRTKAGIAGIVGAVVAFGFAELGLHRVQASHYTRNPQSGAVMRKLGMRHEGSLRQHVYKWGVFEDLEIYGILKEEMTGVRVSLERAGRAGMPAR